MDKKAKVTISGKGFHPGQAIALLLTTGDGVMTDIGYALHPVPKADSSGAWTTSWSCGRFIRKKLVQAGKPYKLTITDQEYNPLVESTVSFVK